MTRKESIHLNQRNRHETPQNHHHGSPDAPRGRGKIGIDFWHAVEFSRSGRTPTSNLTATRRGNPSSLGHRVLRVKSFDLTGLRSRYPGPDRSSGFSEETLPAAPTEPTPPVRSLSRRRQGPTSAVPRLSLTTLPS